MVSIHTDTTLRPSDLEAVKLPISADDWTKREKGYKSR